MVLFSCLDQLFADCPTVSPCDVDVLIVNCSLFTPTPSLASLIINHYHMRQDIQSYQLGGMVRAHSTLATHAHTQQLHSPPTNAPHLLPVRCGCAAAQGCSAGVIGVHLARDLLQVYRAARCVVVSLEVITQSIHLGKDPAFLVSNALFRCGGSAQLYSNRQSDRLLPEQGLACRFSLQWTHRTHLGSDERAYRVVHQEEDAEGHKGVRLGRDLLAVAASAIRTHLHSIGYRLLSYTELSKVAACTALLTIARSASAHRKGGVATGQRLDGERDECAEGREGSGYPAAASSFAAASSTWWSWLRYSPSFSRPDLHACIHAGGRGVLDGIQRSLKLSEADLDVARRILHRHGNTSSSSVFYQLHLLDQQRDAHVHSGQGDERARKRLQRGDAVWLLAFGSGFKVNSALLEAL